MKLFQPSAKPAVLLCLLLCFSCASSKQKTSNQDYRPSLLDNYTFLLTEISSDKSYGYSEKNPVKVGGNDKSEGPLNERRFLNALAGPNGESLSYQRRGSCCQFKSPNGFMGAGLLDVYEVVWEGQEKPLVLYLNMYDYDELKVPVGFSLRQ